MFTKAVSCFVLLFSSVVVTAAEQDQHSTHSLEVSTAGDDGDIPSLDLTIRIKNLQVSIGTGAIQTESRDNDGIEQSATSTAHDSEAISRSFVEHNDFRQYKRYVQWDINESFFAGLYKQKNAGFGPTVGWKSKNENAKAWCSLSSVHRAEKARVSIGISFEF